MTQESKAKTHFYVAGLAAQTGKLFVDNAFKQVGTAGKDGKFKYMVNLTEEVKKNEKDDKGHYVVDRERTVYHEYAMRMTEAECNQLKDKLFAGKKAVEVVVFYKESKQRVGEGESAKYYTNIDARFIMDSRDPKVVSYLIGGAIDFAIQALGFSHDMTKKLMELRKEAGELKGEDKVEPTKEATTSNSHNYNEDLPF